MNEIRELDTWRILYIATGKQRHTVILTVVRNYMKASTVRVIYKVCSEKTHLLCLVPQLVLPGRF